MPKWLIRMPLGVLLPALAAAHDPITTKLTWSREISRLVYKHCGSCHRPGGPSPMSLLNYADARPWAKAIKEEVLERRMPPWNAVKGFGDFAHDLALSWEDIHQFADWVEGGAPEGDPIYLPPRPRYEDPAPQQATKSQTLRVSSSTTLRRPFRIAAIRAVDVPKGGSLRAVARRKDGSVEPLLWIQNFEPRFERIYRYRVPILLEATARIEIAGAGAIVLQELTAPTRAPGKPRD